MTKRVIVFLVLNFAALVLGRLVTNEGVPSEWFMSLNKAPWSPPGWVFGGAWTTIMICFAFYMAHLWSVITDRKLLISLFVIQWILNVGWNPVFFHFHFVLLGLVVITALTVLIGYFQVAFLRDLGRRSILILPYLIWMLIATSLNGYIYFNN